MKPPIPKAEAEATERHRQNVQRRYPMAPEGTLAMAAEAAEAAALGRNTPGNGGISPSMFAFVATTPGDIPMQGSAVTAAQAETGQQAAS